MSSSVCSNSTFSSFAKNKIAKNVRILSMGSKSDTMALNNPEPASWILFTIRSSYLPIRLSSDTKYSLQLGTSTGSNCIPLLLVRGFAIVYIKFSSNPKSSSSVTGYVDSCLYGILMSSIFTSFLWRKGWVSIAAC